MENLARHACYALQMVFMKVKPFPWKETIDCLGSLLEEPYSKLALHKCMHTHGTVLFNYWRQFLLTNVEDKNVQAALSLALTPIREYVRGVWALKESDKLTVMTEVGKWYTDFEECEENGGSVIPSTDQPDSYPMEIVFSVQSKCYSCTQELDANCLCQRSVYCPIVNHYSSPPRVPSALCGYEPPSYYFCRFHTKEDDTHHCLINGSTHIAWQPSDNDVIDYYNVTTDEWFSSRETNPVLAFHDDVMASENGECQCWSECCPCAVQ